MWATWSPQPNLITHNEVRGTAAALPPHLNPPFTAGQKLHVAVTSFPVEQGQPIATATAARISSIDGIDQRWDVDVWPPVSTQVSVVFVQRHLQLRCCL